MNAEISSTTGKIAHAEVQLRVLPAPEKRKRAFKALGLCWAAMIATAPLPPIHFATVPGFFIAGIYLFFRILRQGEHILPFSFACPECSKPIEVAARPVTEEWEQVCPSCHYSLEVTLPLTPAPKA
ncbi:MAG: hypothetical protein EOP11_22035 [Proteobacteria bacterium]|nr:MAG: hypothetical protein EOP11_22035 [Pseudomonadota bacterium]